MSDDRTAIVKGRIVWASGDLFKGKPQTEYNSRTPKLDQKTGQQAVQYGFGLAVPKAELADPANGALWVGMHEEAFTLFPSRQIPPSFAMKYKDGDNSVDEAGKSYSLREGYPGCLVFALTTYQPIRYFRWENGQNIQVDSGIKCGDYVEVLVSIKSHPAVGNGKAGLYLNPNCVRYVAPGKEIFNAPSGDQVFGMNAPGAPTNYVAPEVPPPLTLAPPPPAMAPPPPTAPHPHYGVVPPTHQPPPGGQPVPMAPPPPPAYQPVQAAGMPAPGGYMPPIPR